jgi:peptidoglycan/xylan/chitin deacetylase (PgdA/CDA1 family)
MRHAATLAAAGLAVAGYALPAVAGIPAVTVRIASVRPGPSDPHRVALTFDDGPHPAGTPAILDALAERRCTATFFVIGEQAARYPELCRRVVDEGHEIAVHGWDHRCLLVTDPTGIYTRLRRTVRLVTEITGARPRRYRPPYGVATATALHACRRLGLTPTWWTAWGRDWSRGATADGIARRALSPAPVGRVSVILLHDSDTYGTTGSWRATAEATRILLHRWAAEGVVATSLAGL